MNRALIIPAGFCLVAFVTMLAALHGANDRQTVAVSTTPGTVGQYSDRLPIPTPNAHSARPMSEAESRERVAALADQYLRPWRQWESSPRHLYSRAAPRPIPTITAEIAMVPTAKGQSDGFLLGKITITIGARPQAVPVIVDRMKRRAWMCADGQWLAEEVWLKNAPLP
jgi:hypothetical protein